MNNEMGQGARDAFLELLEMAGTKCDVRGQCRAAIKQERKKPGFIVFQFADEFALKVGDRIREVASETYFDVVGFDSPTVAGLPNRFEVITKRVS
jgi:hypothetical protein